MKTIYIIIFTTICFASCSKSPTDKAQSAVKEYLNENLKNPESYEPISFSHLDTVEHISKDTAMLLGLELEDNYFKVFYLITHYYSITNKDNEKVKMTVTFELDKDLKVLETTKSGGDRWSYKYYFGNINGDYGSLYGNVYWKYNDFVGNRPDANANISLYSLDTIRGGLKFSTTADLRGDYKFEKIPPGRYFLLVRSNNATDCPDWHLTNLVLNKDELKQLFGFDIDKYKSQLDEINVLDSLYSKSIDDFPSSGSLSQMVANINKTDAISKQRTEKISKLFEIFPNTFKGKIQLYSEYSNAYDFATLQIEENKTENNITDFGITCL